MTNSKKKLFTVLAVAIVLCISTMILAACSADSVVKFMVQNDEGEWQELSSQTVGKKDTAVAPTAPVKEYYEFANWYTDKDFTTIFDGSAVKGDMEVYAKYTPIEAAVVMDGVNKGNKKLVDVIANNAGIVAKDGLTFDGWYTDANCQVKWNNEADVQTLYARSMATLTFNNNYEDIYTVQVVPGSKFADPATQNITVDGVETTLEASILKDYMSDRNLDYVDANGALIDFNKPIEKNAVITVLWNSKIVDSAYKLNPKTNNYYLKPSSLPDVPVISLRSDVKIMVTEGDTQVEKAITVEAIEAYGTMGLIKPSVKKIIFGEGFMSIKGISGQGACLVEDVVIPSTTKIIDNSFNNMPKLKGVNVPDGVKAIICSFIKSTAGDRRNYFVGKGYDFDINIPASVTNMAMVPNNFTFSDGSAFYKDEKGYIFLTEGTGETAEKILISDPNAVTAYDQLGFPLADTIVVPECDAIQAGTYATAFNYLFLPSTFKKVNYNINLADNKFYIYSEGSHYANTTNMLYDATSKEAPNTTMNAPAYAITASLGGYNKMNSGKVVFATEAVPTKLDKFAIVGDAVGGAITNGQFQAMTDETLKANVILKDAVNKVYVTTTFEGETVSVELTGSTIKADAVKDALVAKLSPANQEMASSAIGVKLFEKGKEITLGEVKSDMFLTAIILEKAHIRINSAFRLSCDDFDDITVDPTEYTKDLYRDSYSMPADIVIKMYELSTILSKENIINAIIDKSVEKAIGDYMADDSVVAKANIKWSFDKATSLKIMVNGSEASDADLAKIDLSNGIVTIDIEVEFAPYGA